MTGGQQLASDKAQRHQAHAVIVPPPDQFRCQLDEQPGFLVPERRLPFPPDPAGLHRLIVNPGCWISRYGHPPDEVLEFGPMFANFHWGAEVVIVLDDAVGGLLPYSFGDTYRALIEELRPGRPLQVPLPDRVIQVLYAARVLIVPEEEESRRDSWRRKLVECSEMFRENGYAPISGLLHPFHIGALRRYYRHLIRKWNLKLGDRQSPKRFVAHNESVSRFFHHQLTAAVSVIAGERVKPSYVYLASYLSGAALPRHTDRPQCEFSVTFLVDCSPEPDLESPWPIHLETQMGPTTVYQAVGDGLVYRGRSLPHWRQRQPEGYGSTSLFLHYVPENFDGPLH